MQWLIFYEYFWMGIGYFNGVLFRIDCIDSDLFQSLVNGWKWNQNYILADFSLLGDHICRWYPRRDNNQCNQSHHVSPYFNDRRCRYMGVLKWNNLLIKIQHIIKRPTNKRYHKNQSPRHYQSFDWCWRRLSILFFRQKLDYQRYFMCVYHDRFYQNNEVY